MSINGEFIDYIEATGVQTIQVKASKNLSSSSRIVIDYYQPNTSSDYIFSLNDKWGFNCGDSMFVNYDSSVGNKWFASKGVRNIIDFTIRGKLIVNGKLIYDYTGSETASAGGYNNILLFANSISKYNRSGTQRLYSFKLYEDGVLSIDLRPFIKSDGTTGLLDLVSDTFYSNVIADGLEDAPFKVGDNINKLYLFANHNNGGVEDLGSYRLYNMKIEGDLEEIKNDEINYVDYIRYDRGGAVFKTNVSYIPGTTIEYKLNEYISEIGGGLNTVFQLFRRDGIFIDNDMIIQNCNKVIDGGNYYTISSLNGIYSYTFNSNYESGSYMCVGCNNANWTGIRAIEYFKAYQNNILVFHLRPCIDTSGVLCMYDEVSKQYFYNQGTGTFSYKKKLRDFQPVLDSNNVPCLMDKVNRKYYYAKSGQFDYRDCEYKKVSYLKSDGNSYIDLGKKPLSTYMYKIDFSLPTEFPLNTEFRIFGGANDCGANLHINTNGYLCWGKQQSSFKPVANTKYSVEASSTYLKVNGEDVLTLSSFDTNTSLYMILFGSKGTEGAGDGTFDKRVFSIYSFSLLDGDTLVYDLKCSLDDNDVPCLYDKVSQTFFYNQGTGEFSYGIEELKCPPVDYVEYVKGNTRTSTSIDTGVKFNSGYKYIINMYQFNTSSEEVIYGGINYNPDTNRLLYGSYNVYPKYNNSEHMHRDTWNNDGYEKIFNKGVYTINGNAVSNVSTEFTSVSEGSSNIKLQLKNCVLRYYKVYDGEGVLIQSLKPCLTDEGLPALYDEVSKSCLYIDNEKVLSYGSILGYTPISYIESNGTQYIDTGIVPTDNTDIDMVCRTMANNKEYTEVEYLQGDEASYIDTGIYANPQWKYEMIFMDSTVNRYENYFGGTNNEGRLERKAETNALTFNYKKTIRTNDNTFLSDVKYTIIIDKCNIYINNVLQNDDSYSTDSIESYTYTTLLFAGRYSGNIQTMTDAKIYSFKMWNENNTLVFNGIPILDNEGTPCMYDLVTETYFYNQGTGTFGYGDIIVNNGYIMNNTFIQKTYKYQDTNTTVEPNLTASEGATLTLGETNLSYLSEEEIEQATEDGWNIL